MLKFLMSVVLPLLGLAALALSFPRTTRDACDRRRFDPTATVPTVEMIQDLSELVTLRVALADVVTSRIDGVLGGVEAVVLVRGDVTVGTDLSAARIEHVDAVARRATVVLPQPKLSPPRIDHARSRVVFVRETGTWQLVPGDAASVAAIDRAYRDAEAILAACDLEQHRAAARHNAEQVLESFLGTTGWKIEVSWR